MMRHLILFTAILGSFCIAENLSNQDMEAIRAIQMRQEQERIEKDFKEPVKPVIEKGRAVDGPSSAKITIVAYSDFQCPYCSKGAETVQQVKEKYKNKVRVVFKHFPLPFHPLATPASKRFEALAAQNPKLAYKFHDAVFGEQARLTTEGEKFLDEMVKKVGGNLDKVKKELDSEKIKKQLDADMEEGKKFGVKGTPAFIVEGVRLFGAYPKEMFELIIERHLKEKKT